MCLVETVLILQFLLFICSLEGEPDSPSQLTVSDVKATQMRVSWTPPNYDGGTPIIGYLVEYIDGSDTSKLTKVDAVSSDDCTFVVQGLEENTQYRFRVFAENEVGWSTASNATGVIKTLGIA